MSDTDAEVVPGVYVKEFLGHDIVDGQRIERYSSTPGFVTSVIAGKAFILWNGPRTSWEPVWSLIVVDGPETT